MIFEQDLEIMGFYGSTTYNPTVPDMVKEYQSVSRQDPDPELYENLITEEYEELADEWFLCQHEENPTNVLKELSDLVYVIYGYANAMGWDLNEAVKRVHLNNMDRMHQDDGTIKRQLSGKIVKNPNTPKVDLEDLV